MNSPAAMRSAPCALRFALCAAPLAWLWFVLINDLRVEWTVNPQYSYGWAVPFLCVYLIAQSGKRQAPSAECQAGSAERKAVSAKREAPCAVRYALLALRYAPRASRYALCALALLYAPTRLIQEANPGWRLISWALALEVVGITLCVLREAQSAEQEPPSAERRAPSALPFAPRAVRFAICFFLVAVPWPTGLEQAVIQTLTRADAGASVELLGWLGIPAMPHGNIIEVATGPVGIDEACSGIRSFQATLMISLFLGEFYALSAMRRALCVFAGFGLSFVFNLARMTLLVWVAATKGIAAIAAWHDPAGVTILLGCFFGLWGLGALFAKREAQGAKREAVSAERHALGAPRLAPGALRLALCLTAWILLTEVSIEGWYRWHEVRLPRAVQWTFAWPTNNPSFKELPLAGRVRELLRYDEGRSVSWQENDAVWQAVFLRWDPGRTALHLAQNHTPAVCMTAAGRTLTVVSEQKWIEVESRISHSSDDAKEISRIGDKRSDAADTNSLRLPFAIYEVADAAQTFYVFYCLWDDRASAQGFETMGLNYGNRLAPVLAGLRNPGQRSVEIAVAGPGNAADAETAVHAMLEKCLRR